MKFRKLELHFGLSEIKGSLLKSPYIRGISMLGSRTCGIHPYSLPDVSGHIAEFSILGVVLTVSFMCGVFKSRLHPDCLTAPLIRTQANSWSQWPSRQGECFGSAALNCSFL